MALNPSVLEVIRQTVSETLKQLRANPPIPVTLNLTDAARYCGISPSKLGRLHYSGRGPPFVKIDSILRFMRSGLDEWLLRLRDRGQLNESAGKSEGGARMKAEKVRLEGKG